MRLGIVEQKIIFVFYRVKSTGRRNVQSCVIPYFYIDNKHKNENNGSVVIDYFLNNGDKRFAGKNNYTSRKNSCGLSS